MNILICNDDGIFSEGLKTLAKILSKNNNVYVIAPNKNCSGFAHSVNFFRGLVLKKENISESYISYSLEGTPADCVKFGVHFFKDVKFDLVVSGVNIGSNLGTDVLYSGTVSACLEGCLLGYKSIAISVIEHNNVDFKALEDNLQYVLDKIQDFTSTNYVLNVNMPNYKANGILFTKLGVQVYSDEYVYMGNDTYLIKGVALDGVNKDLNCDVEQVKKGFITITPLKLDRTDFDSLKNLPKDVII